jgi:hypothetical protein
MAGEDYPLASNANKGPNIEGPMTKARYLEDSGLLNANPSSGAEQPTGYWKVSDRSPR